MQNGRGDTLPQVFQDIPKYNGAGVYSITTKDGFVYIGSSANIHLRLSQHKSHLQKGKGNAGLIRHLKTGPFVARVLHTLPKGGCWYDLIELERNAINEQKKRGKCLNIAPCNVSRLEQEEVIEKERRKWEDPEYIRRYRMKDHELFKHLERLHKKRCSPL